MQDRREKMKSVTDKLSSYLFDRIGEYLDKNPVTNNEMVATLMLMLLTLIGSLKTTTDVKLEMIDQQFKAMRHAVEMAEELNNQ